MDAATYRATAHAILDRLVEAFDDAEADNWRRILGYFIDAADLDAVAARAIRDDDAGLFVTTEAERAAWANELALSKELP
jgi:hypothetical protein